MDRAWELALDEFIGDHVVGDSFAFDGRNDEDWEWIWDDPAGVVGCLKPPAWTSECGRYAIREFETDSEALHIFLVFEGREVAGFHYDGMNWVDPAHRGRGLGVQLVVAASDILGGSPTAHGGCMGFSEAGIAVMGKAHRQIVERALAEGMPVPQRVLQSCGLEAAADIGCSGLR